MLKGFKDFILRGNVIELSIAVVVGTAFTALVSAFTSNIVNPIIAAAGGVETDGLGFPSGRATTRPSSTSARSSPPSSRS